MRRSPRGVHSPIPRGAARAGRPTRGIRNDVSSYEAIAFALASTAPGRVPGRSSTEFPEAGGALRFDRFFDSLYRQYDERFVYAAPDLRKVTARREWDATSPAIDGAGPPDLDYEPRIAALKDRTSWFNQMRAADR